MPMERLDPLEVIEYPVQTSQWGKSLIDSLNSIFAGIQKQNNSMIDNITGQFEALKQDVFGKIQNIESTANEALLLAKENQTHLEAYRLETDRKLECVNSEIQLLRFNNIKLTRQNRIIKQQSNNNENYSRRKNIIIRGITECENETNAICEEEARKFICNKLKIDEDAVSAMDIVRCHQMGGRDGKRHGARQTQKRKVIVRFNNYKDKSSVWEKRFELNGNDYSLSENISRDTEFNQQKLYPLFKKAKHMEDYKKKVFLNCDTLVIDGTHFTVDNMGSVPDELHPRQFSEKKSDTHFIFGGIHSEFQLFTNWYPCSVEFKSHHFESSEQAYQWAKADHCKDAAAAEKLLYATSLREAKDLGAEVEGLIESDWDQKKNGVMEQILRINCKDNADLKQLLLDSGNCVLAKAGKDSHWAVGLSINRDDIFDTKKWRGQNWLGKLLASIRLELSA